MARPVLFAAPLCHPDRPHLAHGLCSSCYHRQWEGRRTDRPPRRYNVIPKDEPLPARTPNVMQWVVDAFPVQVCPHCGRDRFLYHDREAHCAGVLGGCGQTIYLVRREEL